MFKWKPNNSPGLDEGELINMIKQILTYNLNLIYELRTFEGRFEIKVKPTIKSE